MSNATSMNFNTSAIESSSEIGSLLFSWLDYTLFTLMLVVSALIGIYFGFFSKKQDNTAEYILGGKTMKVIPIAMSLVASHISGITLLAVPSDVYVYGASYWVSMISMLLTGAATAYIYLPVFFKLQLTSSYEYLELRFGPSIRNISSFLFALTMMLFLPIVIYIPALAFSQVTGANIHMITPIVCVVCIFYTTIGGLKAVVWTDTLQFSITIIAMAVVLVLGIKSASGISEIFRQSLEGGRLDVFDFTLNPTVRTSFWSVAVGQAFSWTSYVAVSQSCVQKFMSMPSLGNCRKSLLLFLIGVMVIKSFSVITGLIMYSKYSQCDPLTTKSIDRADQLLPYYVMDVAGHILGLPGLFIAGVFCAALSTMSAGLNTLAGTIYVDFIKPFMPKKTTEKTASNVMKCLVIILGAINTGMVFIVEHLGSILPLSISFGGMASGPLLGMFTLGMMIPFANTKGALSGSLAALLFMGWIVFGAQYHTAQGAIWTPKLPLSTEGCDLEVFVANATTSTNYVPFYLYRISFYYYGLIGFAATMLIGIIVSLLTGGKNQNVDRELLSPIIYWLLPNYQNKHHEYNTVELANAMLARNSKKDRQNDIHP